MTEFLTKIGLIDDLRVELPVEKTDFVQILRQNVDPGGNLFEVFSSSKNVFKGQVDLKGFELRKRRKFLDSRYNYAKATGTFTQLGNTLRIDATIDGFHWSLIVLYVFAILIYAVAIGFLLFTNAFDGEEGTPVFILPFIFLHAAFMLGLPYFLIRRGVRMMKHDLERELHFLLQKAKAY